MKSFSSVFWAIIIFSVVVLIQQMSLLGLAFTVLETDQELKFSEVSDETEEKDVDTMIKTYEDGFYEIINACGSMTSILAQINQRHEKLEKSTNSISSTLNQLNQRLEKLEHSNSITGQMLENLEDLHRLTPDDSRALVSNPVAKLYSEANFTGDSEDYDFLAPSVKGRCYHLVKLGGKVKSIDTLGKCVRLFSHYYCYGLSLALYPGSLSSHNVLTGKFHQVYSIGPCLDDEFELAYFTGKGNGDVRKDFRNIRKYVPDLFQIMSWPKLNSATVVKGSNLSLTHYKLGLNGRLEFVRAEILGKHLNISQPNATAVNIQRTAIPVSIGGPVNELYNLLPQSQSARGELEALAEKVRVFLGNHSNEKVLFFLNFMYESENDKTPYAFYYLINYNHTKFEYGHIAI